MRRIGRTRHIGCCGRMAVAMLVMVASASGAAETVHGTLVVSITVLPSCEVRANDGASFGVAGTATHEPPNAAMVNCSHAFPFRAGLSYRDPAAPPLSRGDEGLEFVGARRVELSKLNGEADRGIPGGIEMLTIWY